MYIDNLHYGNSDNEPNEIDEGGFATDEEGNLAHQGKDIIKTFSDVFNNTKVVLKLYQKIRIKHTSGRLTPYMCLGVNISKTHIFT